MDIQKLTSPCEQFGPPLLLIVSQWNQANGYRTAFQAYVDSYIDIVSETSPEPQLGTTNVHIHKGRMTSLIAGPQRLHIFIDADAEYTVTPYVQPAAERAAEHTEQVAQEAHREACTCDECSAVSADLAERIYQRQISQAHYARSTDSKNGQEMHHSQHGNGERFR